MIDEELYQFATEELNSARRVSELWNRACALACDDHDEARYLYINIRVEELLEEHAKGKPLPFISPDAESATQGTSAEPTAGLENDLSLELDSDLNVDLPASGVTSSNRAFGANFETSNSSAPEVAAKIEPKLPKVEQPDTSASFRSTPSTLEPSDTTPEFDLDAAKAMNQEPEEASQPMESAQPKSKLELDALPSVDPEISSLAASASMSLNESPKIHTAAKMDETLDMDATLDEPLSPNVLDTEAQSIVNKYSSPNNDIVASEQSTADRPLMDQSQDTSGLVNPVEPTRSDDNLAFLDSGSAANEGDTHINVPAAIDNEVNDPLRDDLERQANTWLPSGDDTHPPSPLTQDYSTPGAGAAAPAALTHAASRASSVEGTAPMFNSLNEPPVPEHEFDHEELLSGRGRLYRVFSRGSKDTRAVRRGMSWTAMFFTLPWLVVKRMPGTAIVYALLWIVLIAGLLVTGIHWLDTSTKAPSSTLLSPALWQEQWSAILPHLWPLAYAVLAILGLILLPLFMANRWHASSLIGRGYDEIATVRARTKDLAIERIVQVTA